eukprot:752217-Hanusia_phi.AAC.2
MFPIGICDANKRLDLLTCQPGVSCDGDSASEWAGPPRDRVVVSPRGPRGATWQHFSSSDSQRRGTCGPRRGCLVLSLGQMELSRVGPAILPESCYRTTVYEPPGFAALETVLSVSR